MNSKITSYMQERYGNLPTIKYEEHLGRSGAKVHNYPYGFYTSKKRGDALIVGDIYVTPEYRVQGNQFAYAIFHDIKEEAKALGLNLIIGFSEHAGQNQSYGKSAMKTVNFQKVYTTNVTDVYMRGVQ